jgi:uncharacterized protein YjiS (DUF1127 family)
MTHSSNPVFFSIGSTLLGRTALQTLKVLAGLARNLKHRAEVRQLAEFDDRMLKDIGLSRSDVEGALDHSVFENPSVLLVRSVERRSYATRMVDQSPPIRPVVPSVRGGARCA